MTLRQEVEILQTNPSISRIISVLEKIAVKIDTLEINSKTCAGKDNPDNPETCFELHSKVEKENEEKSECLNAESVKKKKKQ